MSIATLISFKTSSTIVFRICEWKLATRKREAVHVARREGQSTLRIWAYSSKEYQNVQNDRNHSNAEFVQEFGCLSFSMKPFSCPFAVWQSTPTGSTSTAKTNLFKSMVPLGYQGNWVISTVYLQSIKTISNTFSVSSSQNAFHSHSNSTTMSS